MPAFAFLLGRPSIRGCFAYGLVLCLRRRCFLRLLLFCTCPPLRTGALWPMPAWVWRDVRFFYFLFLCFLPSCSPLQRLKGSCRRQLPEQTRRHHSAQWSQDMVTPFAKGLGSDSVCLPGIQTRLHVITSLRTGRGPVSCMQLSEGVSRWCTPLACKCKCK